MNQDELYRAATITNPSLVAASARAVLAGRTRYEEIEERTGVPWYIVGFIHSREASCDFRRSIRDGGHIGAATWAHNAVATLRGFYWAKPDASLVTVNDEAEFCERWNGIAYRRRGINTPYNWSGTQHYTAGKFVADGIFDPKKVDLQAGCMAMRIWMIQQGFLGAAAPVGPEVGAATVTTTPPPASFATTPTSSELQDMITVTAGMPPMPSWHNYCGDWSQVEQDLKRAATDGLSRLPVEARKRIALYLDAVIEAARARVLNNAPAGSTIEAALGLWTRMYHQNPVEMAELRTAIVEYWMVRR